MKNITLLTIVTFILSSCMTLHKGYLSPISQNIDESEFAYNRTVHGESQATYIFGLGGGKPAGLIRDAKEKLRTANPLSDGQALINFTIDEQFSTFFGIITTKKVIISADLISRK